MKALGKIMWVLAVLVLVGIGSAQAAPVAVGKFSAVETDDLKVKGPWVDIRRFGAKPNDGVDDSAALVAARDYLAAKGGGVIDVGPGVWSIETNVTINVSNIYIRGHGPGVTILRRATTTTGWMLSWATTTNTEYGGLLNCTLLGRTDVAGGNGAVAMGYDIGGNYYANKWLIDNVVIDSWSQYGLGVNSGNDWRIGVVRVVNHGITTAYMASCMGAYIYPKTASSGGRIDYLHSEISAASSAIANSCAIKVQVHRNLKVGTLHAKGGTEEACVIDAIDRGVINSIVVEAVTASPGLVLRSRTPTHAFTGGFTINGVQSIGTFSRDFVIGAGEAGDVDHVLAAVTVRNAKVRHFSTNNYATFRDCLFENFDVKDGVILDENAYHATLKNTRNVFRGFRVFDGQATFRVDNSLIQTVSVAPVSTSTTHSVIKVVGDGNVVKGAVSINSLNNGIQVSGSGNYLAEPTVVNPTNRTIWVSSGTGNVIVRPYLVGGTGFLDNGTGTVRLMWQSAAQTDSSAADVATLKTDFNTLLGKLRTAGILAP